MTALSDMLCDLIETLWNVKIILKQYTGVMHVDLIETLWNVKIEH